MLGWSVLSVLGLLVDIPVLWIRNILIRIQIRGSVIRIRIRLFSSKRIFFQCVFIYSF
jgi:hypothetical protein